MTEYAEMVAMNRALFDEVVAYNNLLDELNDAFGSIDNYAEELEQIGRELSL